MNEIIKSKKWTKNWSGNWGLSFGTLYGDIYTKNIQSLVGKKFNNNLITFENGVSANYLPQDELENYCTHVRNLIEKNPDLPEIWIKQIIEGTDKIFVLMRSLDKKDSFVSRDYVNLQKARALITAPNFTIKKVIDYLPKSLVDKFIKRFSEVRVYTEPVYNETDRLLKKIICSIIPEYNDIKYLSVIADQEMMAYFKTKKILSKNDLLKRYDKFAVLFNEEGNTRATFMNADYDRAMSLIVDGVSQQQIKGMPAFKGLVRGRVKVVLDPMNPGIFEEGDILVTGMTRPEYLPLMQKSGGFITDAGGLLSHAAIVARELKKPCVIGTEVATKVLKDGDLVEVDAERGIVKILKRSSNSDINNVVDGGEK